MANHIIDSHYFAFWCRALRANSFCCGGGEEIAAATPVVSLDCFFLNLTTGEGWLKPFLSNGTWTNLTSFVFLLALLRFLQPRRSARLAAFPRQTSQQPIKIDFPTCRRVSLLFLITSLFPVTDLRLQRSAPFLCGLPTLSALVLHHVELLQARALFWSSQCALLPSPHSLRASPFYTADLVLVLSTRPLQILYSILSRSLTTCHVPLLFSLSAVPTLVVLLIL